MSSYSPHVGRDTRQLVYRIVTDAEFGMADGCDDAHDSAAPSPTRLATLSDFLVVHAGDAASRALIRACLAEAGFDWLCYCRIMRVGGGVSRAVWYAEYSPLGWAQAYCAAESFDSDIRITSACELGWAFAWEADDLTRGASKGNLVAGAERLAALAADAGVRSGVSVGFPADRALERTVVTFSSARAGRAWISDATLGHAYALAGALHAALELRLGALMPVIGAHTLTDQQKRMLDLMTQGLSDREIGAQLSLSADRVCYQLAGIERSLGVRNRAQLAYLAGVFARLPGRSDTAHEPA
ncbi:LuxR family transcriptional regulator [Trinickia sp. LjRoot230]|uniref:helix-turn-helix transcriptional regulator n=1 Tax=Trinickia sp. LjRoot230 TaxID=3342288 RepID=UPI003ED0DB0D